MRVGSAALRLLWSEAERSEADGQTRHRTMKVTQTLLFASLAPMPLNKLDRLDFAAAHNSTLHQQHVASTEYLHSVDFSQHVAE